MNIGIDIDDTIAKTSEETDIWAKKYTENILKRKFEIFDVQTYDLLWAKALYGWSSDEDSEFWNLYYEPIVENVKPKTDSIEIINKLYEKHNIFIISARWDYGNNIIFTKTSEWLNKYNIHFNKLMIGNWDKRDFVKANNIDLFIDDSIETCKQIYEIGVKTLIMTSRVNKNLDIAGLERVYSWNDIAKRMAL